MAVAVQEPSTSVDYVTEAVVNTYRSKVEMSIELSLAELLDAPKSVGAVRAVMAPDQRMVEVVLDEDSPVHAMNEVAWSLASDGLHVNVLVGLNRLGEAHGDLRGAPCTLQGWWFEDDDVHFAGFERP